MSPRKAAEKEIKELLKNNDNKIFMGLVHNIYGPLRGLNFQIKDPNINEILDAMDSQNKEIDMGEVNRAIERFDAGYAPQNVVELNLKAWKTILLSVQLLVLPNELLEQAENTPETFTNIKDAIKGVNRSLDLTVHLQKQDPFFFRSGII